MQALQGAELGTLSWAVEQLCAEPKDCSRCSRLGAAGQVSKYALRKPPCLTCLHDLCSTVQAQRVMLQGCLEIIPAASAHGWQRETARLLCWMSAQPAHFPAQQHTSVMDSSMTGLYTPAHSMPPCSASQTQQLWVNKAAALCMQYQRTKYRAQSGIRAAYRDVFHPPHFGGNDHRGGREFLALNVCQALHHRHSASCCCLADHLRVDRSRQVSAGLEPGMKCSAASQGCR